MQAANDAYNAVLVTSIRACWRKCGLLLDPEDRPVVVSDDEDDDNENNNEEGYSTEEYGAADSDGYETY